MKFMNTGLTFSRCLVLCIGVLSLALSGCGGSSDDEDDTGFVRFYNGSSNSPGIFLTVDENLDDDDEDEIEVTYRSVGYTNVSANNGLNTGTYFLELAWQDEENTGRSDLEIIYEDTIQIKSEEIHFIALAGDVRNPDILRFDIDVIDDENDDDDDLFNIRLLNIHDEIQNVDLYVSKDNETFNEAEFVSTVDYQNLSDNIKLEQDQYIFYITLPGSTEVIYTSEDISYTVVSQYIIVLRKNMGVGSSSFTIDSIGINGVNELQDINSEASFGFYNAITESEFLDNYSGQIDINIKSGNDSAFRFDGLAKGQFSLSTVTENGDYSFDILSPETGDSFISDALLSLEENADNTTFLYSRKDPVDEDGDGDFDENGDGIIDDYETVIKSLTLTKSINASIYSHGIRIVNLADSEDFSRVTFFFVLNDENIATAQNGLSVLQESSGSLTLLNNTYKIRAIATIDGTDIILDTLELVLNESSQEQYLVFESDNLAPSGSGYKMALFNQKVAN